MQAILDLYVRSWSSLISGPNQPPLDAEVENDLRTILTRLADALRALRLTALTSDAARVLRCHLARVSDAMSSQDADESALETNFAFMHSAARDEASLDRYVLSATEKILGHFGVWQKATNSLTAECLAQIVSTNVLVNFLKMVSDPTYLQQNVLDPFSSSTCNSDRRISSVSLKVSSKWNTSPDEADSLVQEVTGKDKAINPKPSIQIKRSDSKARATLSKILIQII